MRFRGFEWGSGAASCWGGHIGLCIVFTDTSAGRRRVPDPTPPNTGPTSTPPVSRSISSLKGSTTITPTAQLDQIYFSKKSHVFFNFLPVPLRKFGLVLGLISFACDRTSRRGFLFLQRPRRSTLTSGQGFLKK